MFEMFTYHNIPNNIIFNDTFEVKFNEIELERSKESCYSLFDNAPSICNKDINRFKKSKYNDNAASIGVP